MVIVIMKQLHKLIPVIKVAHLTPDNATTRELVFIKVDAKENKIVIPAGFKITGEATTVDKGIVIGRPGCDIEDIHTMRF